MASLWFVATMIECQYGKISHFGKMVDTHKYLTEKRQQKMLFQTFGTYLPRRITNVDKINVANISLLPFNTIALFKLA
jgi:carotenoid cleavage dioxygenase